MKAWIPSKIREQIDAVLPEGRVIPRHDEKGHFYEIDEASRSPGFFRQHAEGYVLPLCTEGDASSMKSNPVYPSVTGKLQILKDEGLMNYKMNQAIQYVFSKWKEFTDANVMEHLDLASRVSQDILRDAGDIGTRVHGYREDIFNAWIRTGERPKDFLSFIPAADADVRAISAIRALDKFCTEQGYIPIKCEMLVYSHELKTAGTLDDLGLMRQIITTPRDPNCEHDGPTLFDSKPGSTWIVNPATGKHTCILCGYQYRNIYVLVDIKTSNQFKDHYFFQVALYWYMMWKMGAPKPERCYIVKLSKEDGNYKLEELKRPAMLAKYARHMIKTNEGMDFIKSLRKDNQRKVVSL